MGVLDAVVCSPPYAESLQAISAKKAESIKRAQIKYDRFHGKTKSLGYKMTPGAAGMGGEYGATTGQIGALRVAGIIPQGEGVGVETVTWAKCYDDPWQAGTDIVRAAFAHPAKMAKGLLSRILTYGLGQGFWRPGEVLGDPFGGIGTTGIMAAYHGLRALLVELEPKFVALAAENFALHRRRWEALGVAAPVILQGDSRRFAELVGGVAGVLTSPPYADNPGTPSLGSVNKDAWGMDGRNIVTRRGLSRGYGDAEGQIAALPPGDLAGVVTSPPYADSLTGDDKRDYSTEKIAESKRNGKTAARATWGVNKGSTDALSGRGYGSSAGNIAALPAGPLDGAVTSPPWENQEPSHAQGSKFEDVHRKLHPTKLAKDRPSIFQHEYGRAEGQLGNASGETYWQAMAAVYAQVHAALKPRGVLAVVVKDYVKGGARVPLCDQTATLLERLGFAVFLRCRAMLVREWEEPSLFGEAVKRKRERKSFFRRLHESRLPAGDPRRIDHEEVLWCRRL
jgi:hypothetical protein